MRCRQARKNGPRSVSVCPATLLFIGRRALLGSEASTAPATTSGVDFSTGDAVGFTKAKIAKALFWVGIIAALIETRVSTVYLTIPENKKYVMRNE